MNLNFILSGQFFGYFNCQESFEVLHLVFNKFAISGHCVNKGCQYVKGLYTDISMADIRLCDITSLFSRLMNTTHEINNNAPVNWSVRPASSKPGYDDNICFADAFRSLLCLPFCCEKAPQMISLLENVTKIKLCSQIIGMHCENLHAMHSEYGTMLHMTCKIRNNSLKLIQLNQMIATEIALNS